MEITETVTRSCCIDRDMKPYAGQIPNPPTGGINRDGRLVFCQHCGQMFVEKNCCFDRYLFSVKIVDWRW